MIPPTPVIIRVVSAKHLINEKEETEDFNSQEKECCFLQVCDFLNQ